jgi:hypothetical protein
MTPERLPRRFRRLDRLEGAGAYARAGETLLRLSPIPTWNGLRAFEILQGPDAPHVRSRGAIEALETVSPDALLADVLRLRAQEGDVRALLGALTRAWLCAHLRLGHEAPAACSLHLSTAAAQHLYLRLYRPRRPGSSPPDRSPDDAPFLRRKRRCPPPLRRLLLRLPGHKTWLGGELPPAPRSAHARLHWERVRQAAIVDATAAAGRLGVPLPSWKELVP